MSTSTLRRTSLALVLVCGCRPFAAAPATPAAATSSGNDAPAPAPRRDPATALAELEARLLGAQMLSLTFEIVADSPGDVRTTVRGVVRVDADGRAALQAGGTVLGQVGEATLQCDGTTLQGRAGTARLELPCPPQLREAVVVGLVRMGLLHNVARAWSARAPDRADGGIQDWVALAQPRDAVLEGKPGGIAFDIAVDGQPVGEGALLLDDAGLPVLRTQTVHFPDGDMHVVERYESVVIEPASP